MTVNQMPTDHPRRTGVSTRTLLWAGVVGPIGFIATFLVEGATRPGYDPVRQFVSLLSLGQGGWVQVLDFVVCGALLMAFGLGLERTWRPAGRSRRVATLVSIVGLALIASGLFGADPALGFPPGSAMGLPTDVSWHGALHYLAATVVFVGLASAILISARFAPTISRRRWAVYSVVSAVLLLSGWIAGFVVTGPSGVADTAGLFQRIAIVSGFQWLVASAWIELGRHARARTARAVAAA